MLSALCLVLPALGFSESHEGKKKIIAGTSMVCVIVKEIAGDHVEVFSPLPPGMCPGHFDAKLQDLKGMAGADLFIWQGFEKWTEDVLRILENKDLDVMEASVKGNWMIPELHRQASKEIREKLCDIDPINSSLYEKNFKEYMMRIRVLSESIKKRKNISVICSRFQEPFLKWMGCRVAVSYGRSDELNSAELISFIEKAKQEKVVLVVDNLQSGAGVGKTIAREIGAVHITLTNFPLNGSYIEALQDNANKISGALSE